MTLAVGQQAPDFEIPLAGGEKFKLSDSRGKQAVVLLFFPLAWTSVCTAEMCEVRDSFARYAALEAKVVGISVDSPFALAKFKAEENLQFDLASDFNKEVITAYDVKFEDLMGFKGVAKRAAFVVGKDGKILHAEVSDDPRQMPDFARIQEVLKAA